MFCCPIRANWFHAHKAEQNSGCAIRLCLYTFCSDSTKYHRDACCMVHLIETKGTISGDKRKLCFIVCCRLLFVCSLQRVATRLSYVLSVPPDSDLVVIAAWPWGMGLYEPFICAGAIFSSMILAGITVVANG